MSTLTRQERRRAAVEAMAQAHDPDPSHSRQDARLALRLFDETRGLHGLEEADRELLEAAARLHDIGWSVSPDGSQHHKHAFRMIRDIRLDGFTEEERLVVANVARYHRRALPRLSHKGFVALSPEARSRVERLAALLRIADGLDRTHRGAVRDLACRIEGDALLIRLAPALSPDAEVAAALKKADLFKKVFGIDVRVEVEDQG